MIVIVAIMPPHSKFLKRSQGFLIAINGIMGVFSHFCVFFWQLMIPIFVHNSNQLCHHPFQGTKFLMQLFVLLELGEH